MEIKLRDTPYGSFSNYLKKSRLKEICLDKNGVQTGPFGSQLHQKDYVQLGTPIITVEHLGENRIIHHDLPKVSDKDKERLERYILRTGDIVFSRVGSVDRRALVHDDEDGWLFSGRCLRVRPDPIKIIPEYLSWFFGHPGFKEHIRQIAVGATMPSLNTNILSEIPIYYPPLPEQRAIARILGSLDDKIELNRRMNHTLEEMARAIFKSWFMDFDPVRAKEERRAPIGMDAETAALFPDGFEDSELGEVPKGWHVDKIGDLVQAVGGSTPSTKNPEFWEDGTIHFATPKDLSSLTSPVLLETERKITNKGLAKISSGLLPKGAVLLSSRAPIGYLAITDIPVAVNQGFIAMICEGMVPNYYILHWVKMNMDTIIGNANGTTFLEISKKNFRPINLVVPIPEILDKFIDHVGPLHQLIAKNLIQSRTLAALRDSLLPKLISGEIRVENAEKLVNAKS